MPGPEPIEVSIARVQGRQEAHEDQTRRIERDLGRVEGTAQSAHQRLDEEVRRLRAEQQAATDSLRHSITELGDRWDRRIDELESVRDRAIGWIAGAIVAAGALGGGMSKLVDLLAG